MALCRNTMALCPSAPVVVRDPSERVGRVQVRSAHTRHHHRRLIAAVGGGLGD